MTIPLTDADVTMLSWPPKTTPSTGVLVKHLPSGISVICAAHRSQAANREAALRDLVLIFKHRREPAHV